MSTPVARGEGRRLIIGVLVTACGMGLATLEWYAAQIIGVALVVTVVFLGIPWLSRAYPFIFGTRRIREKERDLEFLTRRVLPPVMLVCIASALFWPLIVGHMPRSQDHMVHLSRAWIFTNELLGRGRITGWSSYWFAGYPAGQLYPPATDIWVTLFRFLHLGLLDWATTYAHAFLAATCLGTLALYWLALRASRSTFVAFVAGLLWLLDPGAYREGGWNFTVYWGVWSQVLGLTFAVFAVAALDTAWQRASLRWLAISSLCVGFSLLGHPMSLVAIVVFFGSFLLLKWLMGKLSRKELFHAIAIVFWGGILASWWFVPFVSRSEWTIKVPALWRSMESAAEGVLTGAPFQHCWPVIGVMALIGIIRAAQKGKTLLLGLAVSSAVLLFLSTSTAFEELRLSELSSSFDRIIYQRFSLPAKVAWFVLAAYGIRSVVTSRGVVSEEVRSSLKPWRKISFAFFCSIVCAPFLVHGAPFFAENYLRGVGGLRLASQEPDFEDYQQFLQWSRERWDESEEFYRIAYLQPRNEHFMADAPVYNHTPAYKVGWTPCTTFRHRPESDDPEVLRALSVRYVVSRRPVTGTHLERLREFGNIRVYRLREERPERYRLAGPGRAEVRLYEEEHIKIAVSGATDETRLIFHVSNYADWRATLNGRQIPLETAPIYEDRYPMFMQVSVPEDGEIELRFIRPPLRVAAQIVSLFAFSVTLLFCFFDRHAGISKLWAPFAKPLELVERATPVLVLLLLASVGIVTAARWGGSSRNVMNTVEHVLSDQLGTAKAELRRESSSSPCQRRGSKLVCSSASWGWVGVERLKVGIVERPCIWAHPHDDAKLSITFPSVPLSHSLVGRHGLTDFAATQTPEGASVSLTVSVEEGPQKTFHCPNELGWHAWQLDTSALQGHQRSVTFTIETRDSYRRQYCFDGGVLSESSQ